jgi:6-phosphofructokinase 1
LIEVMGRQSGYLALIAGIAGGAELIVLPEHELTPSDVLARLHTLHEQRRAHAIVVVAEGSAWNADRLDAFFKAQKSVEIFETRVTKLGHVQRGGAPGVYDRILATRLGVSAVDAFDRGQMNVMLGMTGGAISATELREVVRTKKPFPEHLLAMAKTLAQ